MAGMAMLVMRVVVAVVVLVLLLALGSRAVDVHQLRLVAAKYNVTSIIVFGDSSVDPGNNNLLDTNAKGNFPPYGEDFFNHRSTGRLSNGRLATDFIDSHIACRMAMLVIRVVVAVVVLVLLLALGSRAVDVHQLRLVAAKYNVTSIIVFGDSSVDPGNNNLLDTNAKGNFPPYGEDFFNHRSTGRLSNGRLATDFIGNQKPVLPCFTFFGF
ncbi:unnamed protein product [Ilex paraguariensis]|uniref:GDSL esterase/lipase n=1 Tax=Ilex paraguariensis TaxID=185542 RepID=A0ABC8QPM2_9AQUA